MSKLTKCPICSIRHTKYIGWVGNVPGSIPIPPHGGKS